MPRLPSSFLASSLLALACAGAPLGDRDDPGDVADAASAPAGYVIPDGEVTHVCGWEIPTGSHVRQWTCRDVPTPGDGGRALPGGELPLAPRGALAPRSVR